MHPLPRWAPKGWDGSSICFGKTHDRPQRATHLLFSAQRKISAEGLSYHRGYLLLHKKRILTVTALLLNAVLFPDPFHLYNSYQHVTACRDISCACRNPPQPPHLALLRRTTPSRSHVVGPTKAQRTPSTSAMATPQRQRRAARAPSRRTRQVKVAAIGVHGAMHSHR